MNNSEETAAAGEGAGRPADEMVALAEKAGPEESLRAFKLLEALRAGEPGPIRELLPTDVPEAVEQQPATTALHLAVKCAKFPAVQLVLSLQPNSINAVDPHGQTALHLASLLSRADVVTLLLAAPGVDDSITDRAGHSPADVAGGREVATLLSVARAQYLEAYINLLAAYANSSAADAPAAAGRSSALPAAGEGEAGKVGAAAVPASPSAHVSAKSGHVSNAAAEALYHFIAAPRSRGLDFGIKDKASGATVLHAAAQRKDLGLIKLVLARGGDVLVRDRRSKIPLDLAKDERIKSVLRQAVAAEGQPQRAASGAGGGGGAPPAMRGYLHKWTNMARGYRSRWFVLDNGVLSYYRSQDDEGKASRGSISMAVARLVAPTTADGYKFEVNNSLGKSFPSFWLKGNHPVEVARWVETIKQSIENAREASGQPRHSLSGSTYAPSIVDGATKRPSVTGLPTTHTPPESYQENDGSVAGDDADTFQDDELLPPHAEDFELLAQGARTQLETAQQLLGSLEGESEVKRALRGALGELEGQLDEYIEVVGSRERYWVRKYEREISAKRLWEQNMEQIIEQHQATEAELQKVGRDNTRRKRALQEVRANLGSPALSPRHSVAEEDVFDAGAKAQLREDGHSAVPPTLRADSAATLKLDTALPTSPAGVRARSGTGAASMASIGSPTRGSRLRAGTAGMDPVALEQLVDSALAGESEGESDSDDEFYEAIEAGSIVVAPEAAHAGGDDKGVPHKEQLNEFMKGVDLAQYGGYKELRDRLPITTDNRPPMSLWAILKNSIGKDLTKISFPVFFNEPTSMLQRMAEDVEFTECLDKAAGERESAKRIAFVAAFAVSNYSSTIGRISKPFNPMLGETFEYVDVRKKYRYISEQVSHHPPISACIAQAPSWEYFGEVNAVSSFGGKSFEIRPTGMAHVNLRVPKEWAPDAPPAPLFEGLVTEHYSWKKVTTSVSNFLMGSPIIDHYGQMEVTNHQTGEKCILTFKPRGWRGGHACEIKGKVVSPAGKDLWDIAGKWSSQLVARRAGAGHGDLAPDETLPTTGSGEVAPEYLRLWQNSPKPPGMPFNLTPFAVTLNDDKPEIRAWLPPTDCRLRPDQHAFEQGEYERANGLKNDLEEHQRATRKAREAGQLPAHEPRWFARKRDKDTGEGFWEPSKTSAGLLEYWEERRRVGEAKKEGKQVEWSKVDPIYGDFQ